MKSFHALPLPAPHSTDHLAMVSTGSFVARGAVGGVAINRTTGAHEYQRPAAYRPAANRLLVVTPDTPLLDTAVGYANGWNQWWSAGNRSSWPNVVQL